MAKSARTRAEVEYAVMAGMALQPRSLDARYFVDEVAVEPEAFSTLPNNERGKVCPRNVLFQGAAEDFCFRGRA